VAFKVLLEPEQQEYKESQGHKVPQVLLDPWVPLGLTVRQVQVPQEQVAQPDHKVPQAIQEDHKDHKDHKAHRVVPLDLQERVDHKDHKAQLE
jgi:hypothetical protein